MKQFKPNSKSLALSFVQKIIIPAFLFQLNFFYLCPVKLISCFD